MCVTEKERRIKKYMSKLRYKKRCERMARDIRHYQAPYYYETEKYVDGKWERLEKPYVRKIYKSAGCQRYRYYKSKANRTVRRYNGLIGKGNHYRKICEYQWAVD